MIIRPIHIAAGVLALAFGYVALFAPKAGAWHRRSGSFFVYSMVTLSLTGALAAFLKSSSVNLIAGLLTFYFVVTGFLTVRPRGQASGRIDAAAMIFAAAVAILAFKTAVNMSGSGRPEGAPMFIFGLVGTLAAVGDLRMIRAGGIQGPRRITRHLWRLCFAMWVAAASFFWGPRGRVPEVINIPALLPIPVLTPIAVMLYWLWRIRVRKTLRGIVGVSATLDRAEPRLEN